MAPVIFHCSSTLACAGSVWQRYSRLAVSQRSYFSSLRPKSAPNEVRMARRQVLYRSTVAQLQRSNTSQSARAKALQGVTRWHWSGVRGRDQVAGSALIDASRGSLGTVLQRVTKCVEIAVPGGSLAIPGLLRSRGGDRKEPDVLMSWCQSGHFVSAGVCERLRVDVLRLRQIGVLTAHVAVIGTTLPYSRTRSRRTSDSTSAASPDAFHHRG